MTLRAFREPRDKKVAGIFVMSDVGMGWAWIYPSGNNMDHTKRVGFGGAKCYNDEIKEKYYIPIRLCEARRMAVRTKQLDFFNRITEELLKNEHS